MLEAALQYYQGFLEQHRDEPRIENDLTQASGQVLDILAELAAGANSPAWLDGARPARAGVGAKGAGLSPLSAKLVRDFISARWKEGWDAGKFDSKKATAVERRDWLEESADAAEEKVKEVLTQEQVTRLHEIWLQRKGPGAFSDPDVAGILRLSDAQKEQVRKAQDGYWAAWRGQWEQWEKEKDKERRPE